MHLSTDFVFADDLTNRDLSFSDILKRELCPLPHTTMMATFAHQRVMLSTKGFFFMIASYSVVYSLHLCLTRPR